MIALASSAGALVWAALHGPHHAFAQTTGEVEVLAVRYPPEVSPFAALKDVEDPAAWQQLARLVDPGGRAALIGERLQPPHGWIVADELRVAQYRGAGFRCMPDSELATSGDDLVALTDDDVPAMLGLVELTRPGPFAARTIELGGYVGIKRFGRLVAMAGRRLQVPGWVEVSAVCTHPEERGRGLSRRLMNAVIAGIRNDGQQPFLHVVPSNPAVALYERLGFIHHLDATVYVVAAGSAASPGPT